MFSISRWSMEQQLLHQRKAKIMTMNDHAACSNKHKKGHFVVDENDFFSGSISAYILVKDRRPCWMAFSHRSLKNDPLLKIIRSISCVRAILRVFHVKDRRPCWMAFSHRSLKNDPLMKMI
jgi:hypothetical protein